MSVELADLLRRLLRGAKQAQDEAVPGEPKDWTDESKGVIEVRIPRLNWEGITDDPNALAPVDEQWQAALDGALRWTALHAGLKYAQLWEFAERHGDSFGPEARTKHDGTKLSDLTEVFPKLKELDKAGDTLALVERLVSEYPSVMKQLGISLEATTVTPDNTADVDTFGESKPPTMLIPEIPSLDIHSTDWVLNTQAAELESIETETLATYRKKTHARFIAPDRMSGVDRDGRMWRRKGTKASHPYYLRSSLKSQQSQ